MITDENLLHSTGSSTQCSVVTDGEEIHRNRKQNNGFVGLGLEGNGEWLLMGMEFLFSSVQFSRVRLFATP